MKKITFILFALITGTTFAQNSSNASAEVNAEIVSPLKITSSGALNFGKIASTTSAGDVTVTPGNSRTIGKDMIVPGNTTTTVPTFTVTKEEGLTYKVVTGSEILKIQGGDEDDAATIKIKDITTSLESNSGQSDDTFTMGGTLEIAAEQAPGNYQGKVSVTVSYE
ncbi:DUF4402 domain-containing protein [Salinimicrobium sp. GXAS 041]|uniref:DUF4402 domain-containing protein n=1 Tax=Salinimicrobium sp. GXAS 041 TaxID=3400806 RepID=UPI003C78D1F8